MFRYASFYYDYKLNFNLASKIALKYYVLYNYLKIQATIKVSANNKLFILGEIFQVRIWFEKSQRPPQHAEKTISWAHWNEADTEKSSRFFSGGLVLNSSLLSFF